jgi:hypothetical protein
MLLFSMHFETRILAAAALCLATLGCAARKTPVIEPLLQRDERVPVIVIPGLTGTRLREVDSGRVIWGKAHNVFFPRDGGYAVALPLDPVKSNGKEVVPYEPVWSVRLFGVFRKEVYRGVRRLFEYNGYRLGDLDDPGADDSLFFLEYDWRQDSIHTAKLLAQRLEQLRRARGEDVLHVNLLCQSGGCRVARYMIKYGGAELEQARSGSSPPDNIVVDRLVMVGTANGGSLRSLHEMNHGRKYVPVLGRRIRPEVLFSMPSLFDALPAYRDDLFVDQQGRPMAVDLFDPASWETYGWSIFEPRVARRLAKNKGELFGDEQSRARHLATALDRARHFHDLLSRDTEDFPPTRYYMVQSVYEPTPARAMLVQRDEGGWDTVFPNESPVADNPYLSSLTNEPGDGRATSESQLALSAQERDALTYPPVYVDDSHFHMILDPAAQQQILEFLLDELHPAEPGVEAWSKRSSREPEGPGRGSSGSPLGKLVEAAESNPRP